MINEECQVKLLSAQAQLNKRQSELLKTQRELENRLVIVGLTNGAKKSLLTDTIHGYLEAPQANAKIANGQLLVSGWLFSINLPIKLLNVVIEDCVPEQVTYKLHRPDVSRIFPHTPEAEFCGFEKTIILDPNLSGKLTLKIWAILEDETQICVFTSKIAVKFQGTNKTQKLNPYLFIQGAAIKAFNAYKEGRLPLSPSLWIYYLRRYYRQIEIRDGDIQYSNIVHPWQKQDPYQRWIKTNLLTPKLLAKMGEDAQKLEQNGGVKISIIVPVYNTPKQLLKEMIESVTCQIYGNWELCIADDYSSQPHVREMLKKIMAEDDRIKVVFREHNGHIVEATNSALDLATGEYVALLDHDDLLSVDALLHVAECIEQNPDVDWIYTDEDKINTTGYRFDPQFKGEWNPEMAIAHNFTHHLTIIRRTLVEKVGRMRQGYQGAQDLDLFLRLAENTTPTRIKHIPHICYHWRNHPESTASHGTQKQYVFDSACRAIADTIERRGLKAKPFLPKIAQQYGLCLYQLKWDNSLLAENAVTIVIPTRDKVNLLAKCISSLQKTVDERYVKLLIVDDCSQKLETKKYLEQLEREEVLQCRIIYPERETDSFNYARLMNIAAQQVDTPYMLHLNNDVEAIESGWLEDMVGWMSIEDVGVVGARLLYPNYTIQHAGVVIGSHEGLADHLFHYLHQDEVGYICLPHAARNSSAVTGACLLTSTNLYRELEGFDQDNFAVQYNDVDYCLKVIRSGKRIVYTPQATLIHRESESRGKVYDYQEHINFLDKYANFSDPFFNENLDIDSMTMAVNPNHFCHLKRITKLKLLFITHNLNLEGAPLILYRYAAYFVKQGGYEICVVSPQDGYLRQEYEKLNISVKLFPNCFPAMGEKLEQFRSRLNQLGYSLDLSSFDLIVGNTLLSFWGIELARLFNLPSIWHIHESTGIEKSFNTFFVDTPEKIMEQLLPQCFKNASRVVFQAEATRKLYHKYDFQGNFRTIPGGIDVEEIENFCQLNPKSYLRSQYEIDQDKVIISIIGTTCDRKGQHIFVEAIKELAKIDIEVSSNIIGMIVGAREGKYLDSLKNKIQALNLENILIYPETQTVYDFFAMSDIFVCASFEESFPRVILEAMAFKLKIISTDVFGIAEIISDKNTAYLVKPGDPRSLAQKIYKCLKNSDFSARLAKNGYATVCRKFNNKNLLPQHISLAKEGILSYLRDLSPN